MKLRIYDEGLELSYRNMPPVWIHVSILFLVVFITVPIWKDFTASDIITALLVAFGIIFSIFAHEVAHAWAAVRLGHRATMIVMSSAGGTAIWETDRYRRRDDCLITMAGPLANLALGLFCLTIYHLFAIDPMAGPTLGPDGSWYDPEPLLPWFVLRTLDWLSVLNFVWTFVNLLPAYPLDGGHLLSNLLEARFGRRRALFWTGLCGTVLAVLSKVIFCVGVLGGLVILCPPAFRPNISALKASRLKPPRLVSRRTSS
ncbi:metalloprotease [Oryzifoliimicrobium ureilyticus]|uniref:metalloprotease n=1 Tax=Oryzifoliimicrobium ureilyticus TaxID=3113724 RepID=UPI0030766750